MLLRSLLEIFPVPEYISMPACGLDISDRSIKFVEITPGQGMRRFGESDIPPGLIKSGAITNEQALTEVFKKFRSDKKLLNVVASLPEEKSFVVRISLPRVEKSELREAIELHLEEYVPFPASSVVFDYDVVSENEANFEVVISALEKTTVGSYLDVLKASGFVPLAFEIEAQALARALVPQYAKETFFVVDFGRSRTGFAIVERNSIQFSSTIPIGGDSIVAAIVDRFKVKEEVAREMKEKKGLRRSVDEELFFAITPTVSVLRDEIVKHESLWNGHKEEGGKKHGEIDQTILTGGDANIPGLADYLASGSDTPFVLGNPWTNVINFEHTIPGIPLNQSLRYATAIGLALRRTKVTIS